jgi:hypothetical protein
MSTPCLRLLCNSGSQEQPPENVRLAIRWESLDQTFLFENNDFALVYTSPQKTSDTVFDVTTSGGGFLGGQKPPIIFPSKTIDFSGFLPSL